jgi:hypothetical protein
MELGGYGMGESGLDGGRRNAKEKHVNGAEIRWRDAG